MRYATLRNADGSTSAALIDDGLAIRLAVGDVGEMLRRMAAGDHIDTQGDVESIDAVDFAPVVVRPGKIICVGHNYVSHIREMGRELPEYPTLFAKFAGALIGANDDIVLPATSDAMDWEAELAVVVGEEIRNGSTSDARAAIAGYTIANDVSARDWQFRTNQWLAGKTVQNTTPIGPVLVTGDEVGDAADLAVECFVAGERMQDARTSDLLFAPADIVAYVSSIIALEPGDLILTGTTAGVGWARDPQRFLQPGEVVRTTIEGIGELVNSCVTDR